MGTHVLYKEHVRVFQFGVFLSKYSTFLCMFLGEDTTAALEASAIPSFCPKPEDSEWSFEFNPNGELVCIN